MKIIGYEMKSHNEIKLLKIGIKFMLKKLLELNYYITDWKTH